MNDVIYWNYESFGSSEPPANYEEVCAEANRLLDEGTDPEWLWWEFCQTGKVGSVTAIYE